MHKNIADNDMRQYDQGFMRIERLGEEIFKNSKDSLDTTLYDQYASLNAVPIL